MAVLLMQQLKVKADLLNPAVQVLQNPHQVHISLVHFRAAAVLLQAVRHRQVLINQEDFQTANLQTAVPEALGQTILEAALQVGQEAEVFGAGSHF